MQPFPTVGQTFLSVPMAVWRFIADTCLTGKWMAGSISSRFGSSLDHQVCLVERGIVLEVILKGMELHFQLASAVVMPDHVHLLLRPRPSIELSRIMKGIKGASARRINELRGTSRQSVWQDESWDRVVRDAIEFWQKLEYMHWNPAKAGLVTADEVYPFWFLNRDFL